jgi:hypothetical protein
MLKNSLLCLAAIAFITLTSCEKIKDAIADASVTATVNSNIDVPAVTTAGASTSKEITVSNAAITDALTTAKVSTKQVKAISVTGCEVTIPASASFDFSAVESATMEVGGTVVGTMPTGATGKTVTFAAPANQADLKATFLAGSDFKVKFNGKMKTTTTAATLTAKISTKVTFNLGL